MIKEYVDKYTDLRSKMCQKPSDFNKKSVKMHNKSVTEFIILQAEIRKDCELAEKVYAELLKSENKYIQRNAATECLELNLHIKNAVEILEQTIKNGERWEVMGAERQLKIWRGEIGPNDPG